MGTINSEGVYEYDDTEPFAPLADYLNLQADALTAALADIRAAIAAVDNLADSDWVPITTFGTGWTPTVNYTPRLRMIGDRVDLDGAVTAGAGVSFDNILEIPAGFRLVGAYPNAWVGGFRTNGGAEGLFHLTNVAGATQHKLTAPATYRTGTMSAGQFLPLKGSWYKN